MRAGAVVLAGVAALLGASELRSLGGTDGSPDRPGADVSVLAVNICGNACARRPGSGSFTGRDEAVDHVAGLVAASRPAVVGVNEVCTGQKDALVERLPDYRYLARFNGTSVCGGRHDEHYMNVLLVRRDVFVRESLRYTYRAQARSDAGRGEHRTLLCAEVRVKEAVQACVTHLTAGEENQADREKQLREVGREVERLAGHGPAVVLGDLNEGDLSAALVEPGRFTTDASDGVAMHVLGRGLQAVRQRSYDRDLGPRRWSDHPALLVTARLG